MTGKNRVVLPALLALGLISTNANASDPCASVLCLYGKAVGQGGGSECRSAEKDFFLRSNGLILSNFIHLLIYC